MGGVGSGPTKAKRGSSERVYPPAWLPKPAKHTFNALARQLDDHALTKADTLALALMAQWVWVNGEAVKELLKDGVLEEDQAHGDGTEKRKSPAIMVARAATTVLMDIAKQFGMTPSARARLGIEPMSDRSESLAELLRKPGPGDKRMEWVVVDGDPEDAESGQA
jgi:P27 family predicted phage terminase small subunit